jgi:hypothetical protein
MCSGVPVHVDPWADRTARRSGLRSIAVVASLMPSRYPEAGRPADPGQGVDQGAALEAEVRQTGALPALLYLERRATGHRKPDGFAHSGPRPIPLATPPELVVCPLMCEIRVFRYFWPYRVSIHATDGGVTISRSLMSVQSAPCIPRDQPLSVLYDPNNTDTIAVASANVTIIPVGKSLLSFGALLLGIGYFGWAARTTR